MHDALWLRGQCRRIGNQYGIPEIGAGALMCDHLPLTAPADSFRPLPDTSLPDECLERSTISLKTCVGASQRIRQIISTSRAGRRQQKASINR